MQRAPALIAFAILAMSVALALHLAGGRDPFSPGSGVVLGTGFILYAVIAVGGLLLSRGRWVRRLAAGLAAAGLLAASLTAPWSAAAIVAIILSAVALIGLTGRWLDGCW